MNRFTKEEINNFIIGLCVLTICFICIIAFKLQKSAWKDAQESDYSIFATFNRTDGLLVGDKVRMAGIDVGYIENSILDDDFRANLTLKIRSNIQIPDDSSASIVSSGFMGSKYIEIEPGGSDEYLSEGTEFSYTQDAIILEELVDRIISIGKAKQKERLAPTATENEEN